jgi:hypothetical protein
VIGLSGKATGSPSVVDIISPWSTRARSARGKPKERKENVTPSSIAERDLSAKLKGIPPGFKDQDKATHDRLAMPSEPKDVRTNVSGDTIPGKAQSKVLAVKGVFRHCTQLSAYSLRTR